MSELQRAPERGAAVGPSAAGHDPVRVTFEALLFAVLPALLLIFFMVAWPRDWYAWDFHAFWHAAGAVAHGRDPYSSAGVSPAGRPYDPYMYPPFLAELLVPLGLLPFMTAAVLFISASVLAIPLALRLLEVRDWRCYGAAFLWFPVLHGLGLGALTPLLVLAVAACWRWWGRALGAGLLAATVVLKLFLWPLLAWEAGRAGVRSALRSAAACLLLAGASWAAVGFVGIVGYPSLLRAAEGNWEQGGYGLGAVLLRAGLSTSAIGALLLTAAVAMCVSIAVAMRRGWTDERESLALLIGVACVFSPVSWLHYSALLLVPVALFSPRLGPLWFVPFALWATPYEGSQGELWRIALGMLVMWGTIGACVWSGRRARGVAATPRSRLGPAAGPRATSPLPESA